MSKNTVSLKFIQRSSPVLAHHRPIYKISQIILILFLSSRGGRSKFTRLQLFNWVLKSPNRVDILLFAVKNKTLNISSWGFDPVLVIAIRYAIAEGLIKLISSGYELTDLGSSFASQIMQDEDILSTEKFSLMKIGKGITEAMVDEVTKKWELQ